jgi:Flp pilus assembly pilin Flp
MQQMISCSANACIRFLPDEGGAAAIEYALIAFGISVAIAATAVSIGSNLRDDYYGKLDRSYPS